MPHAHPFLTNLPPNATIEMMSPGPNGTRPALIHTCQRPVPLLPFFFLLRNQPLTACYPVLDTRRDASFPTTCRAHIASRCRCGRQPDSTIHVCRPLFARNLPSFLCWDATPSHSHLSCSCIAAGGILSVHALSLLPMRSNLSGRLSGAMGGAGRDRAASRSGQERTGSRGKCGYGAQEGMGAWLAGWVGGGGQQQWRYHSSKRCSVVCASPSSFCTFIRR